ncbi:MAG: hypothetical protein WBL44_05325 [Nitrososphaeraceae archaeon]
MRNKVADLYSSKGIKIVPIVEEVSADYGGMLVLRNGIVNHNVTRYAVQKSNDSG